MQGRFFLAAALGLFATGARAQGHALLFSKAGQAVIVLHTQALDLTGDMTIEAWIKPAEANRNQVFKFIVSNNYQGTGFALLMVGQSDEQRIQFEGNSPLAYGIREGYSEKAFRDTWIHVAGVIKDHVQSLYLNGILVRTNPNPVNLIAHGGPLWIGGSLWGGFFGVIDEVRIWNVARTQEEIVQNKGRYLTGREPGLVAYWTFDEGRGRTAYSRVKSAANGTLGYGWHGRTLAPDFMKSGRAKVADLPKWVAGVRLEPAPSARQKRKKPRSGGSRLLGLARG